MAHIERRQFIGGSLAALGVLAWGGPHTGRAATASIEILPAEPIATINPNIYGHFVEHLGSVVYGGIWVGEKSRVPHIGGIRTALVDALKRLAPPVIRWPGGCFADSYDWRDGIGPRAKRPRRANFWIGIADEKVPANSTARYEPNEFGTNEFMRFCQLVGSKPYFAANLRGLTAQNFIEWVEYCNSPAGSTTLALQRETGPPGSREPFRVEFWGIGNESWGCGGNFTPDEYAQEFRRFTAAVPDFKSPTKYIGAGASSDDPHWTRGFFAKMLEKGEGIFRKLYAWGVHHYAWNVSAGRTNDWNAGKGDALRFNDEQYYELLREADKIERFIGEHWAIMGEYDKQHRVKIAVDEWGSWHRPGTELQPAHLLGQQNTVRDALLAAITLDTFNRHADKVVMGNVAQLVNCLHSLFLADEDKFCLTPTYHVFEMFMPHSAAQAVRTVFGTPSFSYNRNGQPQDFWGLNGSASLRGKQLTLTVTNPSLTETQETEIKVRGASIASARARVLSAGDVHAHNTFANPQAVQPRNAAATPQNGTLSFRFAPASVTQLQLTLH